MKRAALYLTACLLSAEILLPAALVPLAGQKSAIPVIGLEPNRGQAGPDILFLSRGNGMAVKAQSVVYSPRGLEQIFVASNPNPRVSFSNTLPGIANVFTGADSQKWILGIPRYAAAQLTGLYPGIDARYTFNANNELVLQLQLAAGADPSKIEIELAGAVQIFASPDGSLRVQFGGSRMENPTIYPPPTTSASMARFPE